MPLESTIRIAYADDHEMIRQGICELLAANGPITCIIQASDGQDLIRKLAQTREYPDVCVLDIFMPKMDGHATLLEIKSRWPDLKVLVLTGHNTEYYLIKMIRAGASGYLLKNSALREVEKAIVAVHEEGTYFSEELDLKLAGKALRKKVDVPQLTDKEYDVLQHCCSDLSYVQIAEKLKTTPKSVEHCRVGLFKKLGVISRPGLVVVAMRLGLVDLESDFLTTA